LNKIVVSAGFPYEKGENYIHAEQQGDDIFVSKELVNYFKDYLIKKDIANFERFVLLHRDHTAVYSSSDPEDKGEIKRCQQ